MAALRIILLLVVVGVVSGCMTFTLDSDWDKTPSATTGTETVHGSLYRRPWSEVDADKCSRDEGFVRLRFHTNAGYLLISAASLGVYVPQTVEWWCDRPPTVVTDPDDVYEGPDA